MLLSSFASNIKWHLINYDKGQNSIYELILKRQQDRSLIYNVCIDLPKKDDIEFKNIVTEVLALDSMKEYADSIYFHKWDYMTIRQLYNLKFVMMNLFIAWKSNVPLRYARNFEKYTYVKYDLNVQFASKRRARAYAKPVICTAIDALYKGDLVISNKGIYSHIHRTGVESRAMASENLIEIFKKYDDKIDLNGVYFKAKLDKKDINNEILNSETVVIKNENKDVIVVSKDNYVDLKIDGKLDKKKKYTDEELNEIKENAIKEVQDEMDEINEFYKELEITVGDTTHVNDIKIKSDMINAGTARIDEGMDPKIFGEKLGKTKLIIDQIVMRRVFNDSNLEAGGRIYNYYQNFTKAAKKTFQINGEEVGMLDMKAGQITMLYHMEHNQVSNDPYSIIDKIKKYVKPLITIIKKNNPIVEDIDKIIRTIVKKSMLILINAKTIRSALGAIVQELKMKMNINITYLIAQSIIKTIKINHSKIKKYFHSNAGVMLQYKESEVVIKTILRMKREYNVPVLSMHDEIIGPKSKMKIVGRVLTEEYRKVFGKKYSCILEDENDKVYDYAPKYSSLIFD